MPPKLITNRVLDLFQQEGRTPGLHVSSAIHRVMRSLHPDRFTDSPIDEVRALLGNAMEHAIADALARRHPDRYHRLQQLEYDGIVGNADLLDVEEYMPVEIKLTWASSRRAADIEDSWFSRYWWQLKAYAKMIGAHKGSLIIFFVNGDYKGGGPEGFQWIDEWTDEELEENWDLIKMYATEGK